MQTNQTDDEPTEDFRVYLTENGHKAHPSPGCPSLRGKETEEVLFSEQDRRLCSNDECFVARPRGVGSRIV